MDRLALAALGMPAHVGHVVADLDAAMADYTEQLGVQWAQPVSYGRGRHASRFTCSRQAPFQIELIQQVAGSIWVQTPGAPFHHLAYWSSAFDDQRDQLVGQGMTLEADGPTFAYLRGAGGVRIELMDRSLEPAWDRWLAGGHLFG